MSYALSSLIGVPVVFFMWGFIRGMNPKENFIIDDDPFQVFIYGVAIAMWPVTILSLGLFGMSMLLTKLANKRSMRYNNVSSEKELK